MMHILSRFKYKKWKQNEPTNILEYLLSPCSNGLRIVNFFYQKVLRINSEVPFMVHYTSIVSQTVKLGKNVAPYFANSGHCYIQGINGIVIGDNSIFAPGVKIISANHSKTDFTKHDKSLGPIIIGKSCWIGANAVILPGVHLGDNVIVGAGSVVTKSFESNLVVAGNPAKIIGKS
ncbi:MAG: acyltransferase [Imperialibacter sp.]|uniref:acyltransferase n=1 Tax=Imperialibacter sp. TaxID=2038411 RepID=UPI003A84F13D